MQNKLFAILITALLVLAMAGSAMCATYTDEVTLVEKENFTSTWDIVDGGCSAIVEYNASGDVFVWRAYGTVPNFSPPNGEPNGNPHDYALIYYADEDDRFNDWGGDNPGALLGIFQVSNAAGEIGYFDSGDVVTNLDINMPESPDFNIDPDPWDEYCSEETDDFTRCCGAKLWIVPCDDYDEPGMTAWNPADYLFETDFIWYDNTGHNLEPEMREPSAECGDHQAGDTVNITAKVCDYDGVGDLEDMEVTANFTEYGVEELVVLELDEVLNCICATYTGAVVINETGNIRGEVVATDPAGGYSDDNVTFVVEHGDCAYMELHNRGAYDEDLRTVALTELARCNRKDYPAWWSHGYQLDIYMIRYTVHVYDMHGNHIGEANRECCDGIKAAVTGEDASLKFSECKNSKVTIVNEHNPGETTLTVRCLGSDIPEVTQVVEFLNPIAGVDVTSNVDVLYGHGGCDESGECPIIGRCDNMDKFNITAQIVDLYGEPILMPRVPVTLIINNEEYDDDVETDENGTATFELKMNMSEYASPVTFVAWSECHEGTLTLDVIDPVLSYVEVYSEYESIEFGESSEISYACYTDHDTLICRDGAVASATLGTFDGTDFVAGDVEGIAVISFNVSGVVGTVEIVINGTDCEDIGAASTSGIEQTMESGTVSVSWNFTGMGSVCVQALGDPIPEWDNDTKGALVFVESDDSNDTATLDLNGTGDTWMLNDTTWEFYAAGDTSEVGLGIYQMFALVYDETAPDPDPEPTPTATTSRSSRGGGGGGTYPPDPVPTPTPNATDNETDQDDPKPAATKTADVKPTVNLPGGDTTLDTTPDDEDDAPDGTDPTSAIFIVLGILALIVIGYVLYRKSQQ